MSGDTRPEKKMKKSPQGNQNLESIWSKDTPSSDTNEIGKKSDRVPHNQFSAHMNTLEEEMIGYTTEELRWRIQMLQNEIQIMKSDIQYITHEKHLKSKGIEQNLRAIEINRKLPNLVANVVEIFEPMDIDKSLTVHTQDDIGETKKESGRSAAIRTSTKETIFLPVPGLVDPKTLKPGDLVAAHKDTYLIFEKLPDEIDNRVKAFELDERPIDSYADIAGLDSQIQELIEAVVLPMTHTDMFRTVGVQAPKGVLLHGPPGTGKTLLARACSNSTNALFLKLAGPELVQMYIGDGAKLIRSTFEMAKKKIADGDDSGAIIFIDEIDAIGTKRHGDDQSGEREVQRTLLELLSQMDGFSSNDRIKVICATNRADILDPALLRSGRIDRKIELPSPDESSRASILKIHSRRMNVSQDVDFAELARTADGFNGAQLKVVCVEAGMLALRRESENVSHEDYVEAIHVVTARKKRTMDYFL